MDIQIAYYKTCLRVELARRCQANPRYSLRAFGRAIGIDPSTLSKILRDKTPLSAKAARRVLDSLSLAPEQRALFLESLGEERKTKSLSSVTPHQQDVQVQEIDLELFQVIADWYHAALFEMVSAEGFRNDPRWIAAQLGISVTEVSMALARLKRVGMLVQKGGKLVQYKNHTTTQSKHVTTAALKRRQRQVLELSIRSLENDPIEERSHTCMTMAIDPSRIDLAKRLISGFNHYLCNVLSSRRRTCVYHLAISLYPVQKKGKSK